MSFLDLTILAVIQGLTEYLPVSSSGHLVLIAHYLNMEGDSLELDIAVHFGSLFAAIAYFRREIIEMLLGIKELVKGQKNQGSALAINCITATIPVLIAGLAVSIFPALDFRNIKIIGFTLTGFGILLYLADKIGKSEKTVEQMSIFEALIIGISQIIAILPGTSRSGITMTTARFLGFERKEAAKFSMLISIPAIAAAGGMVVLKIITGESVALNSDLIVAVFMAFIVAYISIWLMMKILKKLSFTPFVIYRIILGILVLKTVYGFALTS